MKQKMRYILLGIGLIIFNASAFCRLLNGVTFIR